MNIFSRLQSRIQYKIILPFMLLTLLVALTGSAVALLFITGNAQERLNNQIAQVARDAGDAIVQVERANLSFLREIAFAPANPSTSAPAVADALMRGESAGLEQALEPYFRISTERGVRIDRLIVFDRTGRTLVDWERINADAGIEERTRHPSRDLSPLWFVPRILNGQQDNQGDKYAGLLDLDSQSRYLFTVAPITAEGQIVGGVIAAIDLNNLVRDLAARSQAAIVTIHEATNGTAFSSTAAPISGLEALNIRGNLTPLIRQLTTDRQEEGIFDTIRVNERDYQFAYAPLRIRGAVVALLSVALASDYVITPWSEARLPLSILTLVLMLAIIGLGFSIARQITRPLEELVNTAEAVTAGDLERRSKVKARDEVGKLARAFNTMTGHLLALFRTVRSEANQRAAIFESIVDGIVVVDGKDRIMLVNPALRSLLALAPEDDLPHRFSDLPLRPLDRVAMNFGGQYISDLYEVGKKVVRLTRSTIRGDDETPGGYVYVLQDMTSEVAVDQAKTNFIATISHELRTPMTVISGNAELMLSGLLGQLNDEYLPLVQSIRRYASTTTSLINNMITVAGLDAGTLVFEPEPVDLYTLMNEEFGWMQRTLAKKGLELQFLIPDDLPFIIADRSHLANALRQLLDNASRYTSAGGVRVCAYLYEKGVRVDVSDTGPGIMPDLHNQIFDRFTRGPEGINSTERGIGLGLAIVRELTERQGGQVWLDSSSENGSTFSVFFPQTYVTPISEQSDIVTTA